MRNVALFIFFFALAGMITGWLMSHSGIRTNPQANTAWQTPAKPDSFDEAAKTLAKSLKENGHFGSVEVQPVIEETQEESSPVTIAFPQIIAVSDLDGTMYISLKMNNGILSTARAGDIVEGDWTIRSIDMQTVIVEKEGSVTEFTVYPTTAPPTTAPPTIAPTQQ